MSKRLLMIFLMVAAAVVYYLYEPTADSFYPRCVFLSLTGYECAGCGMQRAIHSLLHLDIKSAIGYNAYFVALLPVAGLMSAAFVLRRRLPRLYDFLFSSVFLCAIGIGALLWWVARNVWGW